MVDKGGKFTNSNIVRVDFSRKYSISILPNPVHDIATIVCPDIFRQLQFTDISGKLVLQVNKRTDNRYDLSALKKGMYLVRLISDDEIITEKLIIE